MSYTSPTVVVSDKIERGDSSELTVYGCRTGTGFSKIRRELPFAGVR